jgi:hypothetical protein
MEHRRHTNATASVRLLTGNIFCFVIIQVTPCKEEQKQSGRGTNDQK